MHNTGICFKYQVNEKTGLSHNTFNCSGKNGQDSMSDILAASTRSNIAGIFFQVLCQTTFLLHFFTGMSVSESIVSKDCL